MMQRAVKMLQRNKKEARAYVFTLSVTTCLLFLFVNIQKDTNFIAQNLTLDNMGKTTSNMIGGALTLMIAAICFANTFIINNYYNHAKAQEICVFLSSGMNVYALTRYLMMQNFILLIIAVFIGGGFGFLFHIGLNQLLYQLLQFQGPLITLTWQGIGMWLVILGIEIVFLALMNVGYAYKAELKDLLVEARTLQEDKRKVKVPSVFYVIMMLAGWIGMVVLEFNVMIVVFLAFFGMVGIHGCLHYGIRDRIEKQKKTHRMVDFRRILVKNNVMHLIHSNYLFILLMMTSVIAMSCLLSVVQPYPYLLVSSCVAYLFILLVMSISMVLKIIMVANKRQEEFKILRLMGAKEEEMRKCVNKEAFILYACVLILPLIFALTLCIKSIQAAAMGMEFLYFIIGSYVGIILLFAFIAGNVYSRIALHKEEEDNTDEVCN